MAMKEPKVKIFVAHHKPWYVYEDDVYVPIQVWKKNAKVDLWILWDDTWDNISEKNSNYAELTAQYWVWKNYDLSDVDYVGFCHYRRYITYNHRPYFKETKISNFLDLLLYLSGYQYKMKYKNEIICDTSKQLKNFIGSVDCDVYCCKAWYVSLWPLHHLWLKNDVLWNNLREILLDNYSDFSDTIIQIDHKLSVNFWNLFIMKKKVFFDYSDFIFTILTEFEKEIVDKNLLRIVYKEPMTADTRFLWCLGERLLNLWLENKKHTIYINKTASKIFFTD